MGFKEFEKFVNDVNGIDIDKKESYSKVVERINIGKDNFNDWADNVFSDNISKIDMNKLPYVIDALYQTDDRLKFMLCCMLLESTTSCIGFLTNLENYPLSDVKYQIIKETLITIYENCYNDVADCMTLIILNNDQKLELFNEEEKIKLIEATKEKLYLIKHYLENSDAIEPAVYDNLELIVDLACYMRDSGINDIIEKLDKIKLSEECNIFIEKYKAVNGIKLNMDKIKSIINNQVNLEKLLRVMDSIEKVNLLPLEDITQDMIAKSSMIEWLRYPTELGKIPDEIVLLGEFEFNGTVCYAFKFKSKDFKIKDYMIGIAGGYEPNKLTIDSTGLTFSDFEVLREDYIEQAKEIAEKIMSYWKNRA